MSSVLDEVLEGFEPSPEIVSLMLATEPAVLLGIDIGTSGVRAALFNENGQELPGASAQKKRNLSTQTGLAEIDAEAALRLVAQTIDDLLVVSQLIPSKIELISISCFWHSLVGVNSAGRAITPVLLWADTRSLNATAELRRRFDEREIHARTGCRFHPSYWPAKLLWLREQRTQFFQDVSLWLGLGEYLTLRLCGRSEASISMASATGLVNQRVCDWDLDFIGELKISPVTLPRLSLAGESLGQLNEEFMIRWPQLSNARIYPAIGDGAANNIGAGCHSRDKVALMVGTSGALRVLYQGEPPEVLPGALWCYRADGNRVVVGGALSDGGGLYRWLTDSLCFTEDSTSLADALADMEPDSHGLTILPFWAGERSPGWTADARGAILGLTIQTQPAQILRAAMEAIAYRFASIWNVMQELAPGAAIYASGNALQQSPVWVKILADVLNCPINLSGLREASMRGAALLALEAAGKIPSIEEFANPVESVIEPDASLHLKYQQGLERQQHLYDLLHESGSSSENQM